jgi:hypothetical protein
MPTPHASNPPASLFGREVETLRPQPRYLSISYEYKSTVVGLGGVGFKVLGLGFRFRWDLGFRALGLRFRA